MCGTIPPLNVGSADMSASAAASAVPRAEGSYEMHVSYQALEMHETFVLSHFVEQLIQDYMTTHPEQAEQFGATISNDPEATLPREIRKLILLQLIPIEFRAVYVVDHVQADKVLIALREVSVDLDLESDTLFAMSQDCCEDLPDGITFPLHNAYLPDPQDTPPHMLLGITVSANFTPADRFQQTYPTIERFIRRHRTLPSLALQTQPTLHKFINPAYLYALTEIENTLPTETFLHLHDNRLKSDLKEIPPELWQLTQLKTLSFDKTGISYLPPELGLLTHLQELTLFGTKILKEIDIQDKENMIAHPWLFAGVALLPIIVNHFTNNFFGFVGTAMLSLASPIVPAGVLTLNARQQYASELRHQGMIPTNCHVTFTSH